MRPKPPTRLSARLRDLPNDITARRIGRLLKELAVLPEKQRLVEEAARSLDAMYRMPSVFGPCAGPRNVPPSAQSKRYANDRTQLTIDVLVDQSAIERHLPPACHLAGAPVLRVSLAYLSNIGWLAGRGYNIVTVQFLNIAFKGQQEEVVGTFDAVLWENLCDPIITGREEIAVPKIYAEIPDLSVEEGRHKASASWLGYKFFDLTIDNLVNADDPVIPPPPRLNYKYIPRSGAWGLADSEYMMASMPDANQPPVTVHAFRSGEGTFDFHPASWEDMPTQFHIVTALAAIPVRKPLGANLRITSQGETASIGGGYAHTQRRIT